MKCIFHYNSLVNALNSTTKENLITYHKTYKIIVLKKHVNATHALIGIFFEEEVNNLTKGSVQRQPRKKRHNVFNNVHYKEFCILMYSFSNCK